MTNETWQPAIGDIVELAVDITRAGVVLEAGTRVRVKFISCYTLNGLLIVAVELLDDIGSVVFVPLHELRPVKPVVHPGRFMEVESEEEANHAACLADGIINMIREYRPKLPAELVDEILDVVVREEIKR